MLLCCEGRVCETQRGCNAALAWSSVALVSGIFEELVLVAAANALLGQNKTSCGTRRTSWRCH